MQRLATSQSSRILKPVGVAVGATAGASSTAHCRVTQDDEHANATKNVSKVLTMDEDEWSIVLPTNRPVEPAEVMLGLQDLTQVITSTNTEDSKQTSNTLYKVTEIEEDDSSDCSSNADHLLNAADRPYVFSVSSNTSGGDFSSTNTVTSSRDMKMNDLANLVAKVVNDPVLGPQICSFLDREATFQRLIDHYAPATLHSKTNNQKFIQSIEVSSHQKNPKFENAIASILKFVLNLAGGIGHAICALGGQLRRLPEDLKMLLENNRARTTFSGSSEASGRYRGEVRDALIRVAVAVCIAVVARRFVLLRTT